EIGRVDAADPRDAISGKPPHLPGAHTPRAVADPPRLVDLQGVEQPGQIADEMMDRVRADVLRRTGVTVAALIGGDGAKARRCDGFHLMPPGVPKLREAVAEKHRKALPGLGDGHGAAVGLYGAMRD